MANTKIPVELSSTPSIVDNGNATAITIDSSENATFAGTISSGAITADGLTVNSSEVLFDNTGGDFTLKLNTNAVGDKNEIIMGDSGTPLAKFGVGGTANDIITGSDGQDFNIGTAGGGRAINFSTDNFASVEMKLDDGNLLVGTTDTFPGGGDTNTGVSLSSTGAVTASRDGDFAARFNRKTSDGEIIGLNKDGLPVGSIGTSGGLLNIGSGDIGLLFIPSTDVIVPSNPTDTANGGKDAAIDLGNIYNRFKDLYLSGGAYIGGTGSANHLDDYEEGTWTAELKGSTGSATTPVTRTGTYTKVGNLVHVQVGFVNVNTTGASGSIQVTGLPFSNTSANASTVTLGQYTNLAHSANSNPTAYINPSANLIQMTQYNDSAVGANWFITATTGVYFYVSATYTI